tara:strand:+ start:134 stop:412 length:279 start_codon:yes stop_codon:yes gene_type:complete
MLTNKTIQYAESYHANLDWKEIEKATQRGYTRYWPEYSESLALSLLIAAKTGVCCDKSDLLWDLYVERKEKLTILGYDVDKLIEQIEAIKDS